MARTGGGSSSTVGMKVAIDMNLSPEWCRTLTGPLMTLYIVRWQSSIDNSFGSWNQGATGMESKQVFDFKRFAIDKNVVRKIVADENAKIGFVPDPIATPEKPSS